MSKARRKPNLGTITCAECGTVTEKNGPSQRYCQECSTARDIQRKAAYAQTKGKQKFEEGRAKWRTKGRVISREEQKSLFGSIATFNPGFAWHIRLAFPFSWAGSKNHLFTTTRTGHTFLRDEARYYRTLITAAFIKATREQEIANNKLWIDIYVQKPNHRGDAANFLDLVCDAIKDAIPLDDRWYSVRGIDWQITKDEPMLYIGIGQEDTRDVQACSSCGRLLEFHHFHKNKAARHGIARVCRECLAAAKKKPKEEGIFA